MTPEFIHQTILFFWNLWCWLLVVAIGGVSCLIVAQICLVPLLALTLFIFSPIYPFICKGIEDES